CVGGSPVVCAASDQCHVAGTCNPATGACSNPAAADGTACSDGDPCTSGEACSGGLCGGGAPVGPPAEVDNQIFFDKTHQQWDAAASGGGPAPVYDVVGGLVSELPVGSGPSELCRASGIG